MLQDRREGWSIGRRAFARSRAPQRSQRSRGRCGLLAEVDEPLRSSHLLPLLAGDKAAAFAFTESDAAPHPTRATSDGDWLVVEGQKSYVTGGADADFLNTLVHVDDAGSAILVIDTATEGVELCRKFSSLDGSHHAVFEFHQTRVPKHQLVGQPGEGLPRAMRQIGDTRLAIAATCVGTARWVLAELEAQLKLADGARGKPSSVRLRFADLRIATFAARSMLYRTARLADAGANVVNEGIACKVFATETVHKVVDGAIQLFGGKALVEDHPLAKLYRQVRVLQLAEGANDVLRLNLARGRLELDKGVL